MKSHLGSMSRLRSWQRSRPSMHWLKGDGTPHPPRAASHPWKKRVFPVRTATNETNNL